MGLSVAALVGCPSSDPIDGDPADGEEIADTTGENDVPQNDTGDVAPQEDPGAPLDAPDAPPDGPSCAAYCDAVQAACTGEHAQYPDKDTCLSFCAALPLGEAGETNGHSVACRSYHAGVAASDFQAPPLHCPHAGPTGGDVCGGWCTVYCALSEVWCEDNVADLGDCAGACADFGTDPTDSQDTLQCRLGELVLVASDGAAHCANAALDGGTVCVDGGEEPSCAEYCAVITDACVGDNAQYADEAACIAYCTGAGAFPIGTADDTAGNTVGCRSYHAGVALQSDPELHCPHAGPSGGDVCGSWCANYCSLAAANCTGTNALFADEAECGTACAALSANGAPGDTAGDSLQCRIYHLGVAGGGEPDSAQLHCPHAAPDGGGVCVQEDPPPTCEEYCAAVTSSCTGEHAQYPTEDECLAYCKDWAQLPAGTADDTSGNTLGCRIYHAGVAGGDDELAGIHCPHAGPTGGNVCGSWCDAYCHLAQTNCLADNTLFADSDECATACSELSDDGAVADVAGDSVQCRIYHLGVAGADPPASAETHCPHGGPDGAGVCVTLLPADTCDNALSVDAVPFTATGDTTGLTDDYGYPAGQCPGETGGWGLNAPDQAWVLEVSETATYQISVSGDFDSTIYVVSDCAAIGDSCLGAAEEIGPGVTETVTVDLTAGATVFVIVDGWGNSAAGTYTLTIEIPEPVLEPTCDAYCAAVQTHCTGANAQYATGDECLTMCETVAGFAAGTLGDDGNNTIACRLNYATLAADSAEAATAFCPAAGSTGANVCGTWCTVYCQLAQKNCTGDAELFETSGSCLAACGVYPADGGIGEAEGNSVQCRIYHLQVAGTTLPGSAAIHCPHGGPDGGEVCAGEVIPPTGETCDDALPVGALPFAATGTTSGFNGDYAYSAGACPPETGGWGSGAPDVVYAFTPALDGTYAVAIDTAFDSNLYVVTDCGDVDGSCVAGDEDVGAAANESVEVLLEAGTTVFVIIDGWAGAGAAGDYELTIQLVNEVLDPTCEAYCAEVTAACAGAKAQYVSEAACLAYCGDGAKLPLGAGTDTSGNTVGCRTYHAQVASASAAAAAEHCPHAGPSGGDVCGSWCEVYCQLAQTGCQGDLALFSDDAACAASCALYSTDGQPGNSDGDSVQCRIYHLGVAVSDGESSAAIHCPHGGVDGGGVCIGEPPSLGETCADALTVVAVPFTGTGNTVGFDDDYAYAIGACPPETGGWGAPAPDAVYQFTPTADGSYHVALSADFDSTLYVVADCGDVDGTCLGGDEVVGTGQVEDVDVDLSAGQTYFIIVDGWGANAAGSYQLEVSQNASEPSCADYCAAVTAACTGGNAQYVDEDACNTYCAEWASLTMGTLDDTDGNTVGCRMYHAGEAALSQTNAAIHCPHAGPSGANTCGTWCEVYCDLAATNCSGDDALFADDDSCQTACAAYPAGEAPGTTDGDSVQCRIYHLGAAGSDPPASAALHCPHGGIDGGGVCAVILPPDGETCATALVVEATPFIGSGDTSGLADDYAYSFGACPPETGAWGDGAPDQVWSFVPAETGLYAITLSADFDSNLYVVTDCADVDGTCVGGDEDAGAGEAEELELQLLANTTYYIIVDAWGGPVAGTYTLSVDAVPLPTCEEYCSTITAACTDATAQYASEADCLAYCAEYANIPIGTLADVDGDTVGCRIYHAKVASVSLASAAVHCPHAGPSGGDTCGGWCDVYCGLATTNCTGGEALYPDAATCEAACEAFPTSGLPAATEGDSVQCRIYHLGVAGNEAAGGAAVHCAHGSDSGGEVCIDPPTEPTCADYCAKISAVCTGDNAQYESESACLDYCATFGKLPVGELSDTAGNTIGCRIYHADVASADAESAQLHCPHAGPSGGDVCGAWCEVYCQLSSANCAPPSALFPGDAECLEACAAYSDGGDIGATGGDSVQCRIYHLGVAGNPAAGGPETHCAHGDVDGGGVCSDPKPSCEAYCDAITASCSGENAQYQDHASCMIYCESYAQLPIGELSDTAGNTVGCRTYHAGVAATDEASAEVHCPHAGPSGGDVCGTWCENYCDLAATNCTGSNALFTDDASCAAACAAYDDTGIPLAAAGDNVQCRIFYLGVAGNQDLGGPTIHCKHGDTDGGGVCVNPDPLPDPDCDLYCGLMSSNCVGGNAQYASEAECQSYCKAWGFFPKGTADDKAGDTLGCRQYFAGLAGKTNTTKHCASAGPSGGDVCGTWCDSYCRLSQKNCKGGNTLYPDTGSCLAGCAGYPSGGAPGDTDGDSVQCRIYHLGFAGSDWPVSASVHCPHGAADGGGVCVGAPDPATCEKYCAQVTASCTGSNAQYANEAACVAYCSDEAKIPLGTDADVSGNTVGCRTYHATVASVTDPALHCPHAGPSGGDQCGSWCEVYCGLASTNCTDANALFVSESACASSCGTYPTDGDMGATEGDSVQCRIYHLGVAGNKAAGGPALHCPHGSVGGGGVCSDDEPPPEPTCAAYCATIQGACTGANAQYDSEATCIAYCTAWGAWPTGAGDDTSGNTLGCRQYHAGIAAQESPEVHCAHAGPSGGNVCGTWCDAYCQLSGKNCKGGNTLFPNDDSCQAACLGIANDGDPGAVDGNSVQCRIYHLGVAGSDWPTSASIHCPHGALGGGGVCGDDDPPPPVDPTCAAYCDTIQAACTGADAQYTSEAECLSYCSAWGAWPKGTGEDTTGNTLGCRQYHAGAAAEGDADPSIHCAHAGPTGGNVCGTWCDAYCQLALKNCVGGNALYATASACQTACAAMSDAGVPGDTEGETIQCRIYHLGVAGSDWPTSAAIHCPHGAVDGGGVCVPPPEPPGDTCDNPFVVGALPFSSDEDTSDATNDYSFGAGECPGESNGWGAGSPDHVYQLTPTADGTYLVTLSGFDSALYVVSDCGDIGASCLAADEEIGGAATEQLQLELSGGVTYSIVVDGWSNTTGASGSYTLTIAEQPKGDCGTYCKAVTDNCGGGNAQYASEKDCLAYCGAGAKLPLGTLDDTSGNTVGCRQHFAELAGAGDAAVHCPKAGPSGANVCGTWCGVYCHLAQANCTDANALYGSDVQCLTACGGFDTSGSPGDTDGDSAQCRIYHLGVAGDATAGGPAVHCPHGAVDGGGVCVDAPGPPTWTDDVQPIFQAKCSGGACHNGANVGGHNLATDYAAAASPSYYCPGKTKAECTIVRIKDGSMPLGKGCSGDPVADAGKPACLTAAEQALIDAWVTGGTPE